MPQVRGERSLPVQGKDNGTVAIADGTGTMAAPPSVFGGSNVPWSSLAEIGKLLKAQPDLKVYIVGHTDNAGGFDYNMSLSQRRAKSVVDQLIQSYGISLDRLKPAGAGLIAPVAANDDGAGRSKNRRVEIVKQ